MAWSTAPKSAFTGPLPVTSALRSSPRTVSETVPVALPPCDEVTLQPSMTTDAGTSAALLLDEGEEVGVGDLLLGVGEGDGRPIHGIETLAVDLVAELAQLALEAAPARTACRSSAGCRSGPTDWGVMIS